MPRKVKWSDNETYSACKSWLEISDDPHRGTNQDYDVFWTRITDRFYEKCRMLRSPDREHGLDRTRSAVKTHFATVSKHVGWFVNLMNLPRQSGCNEQDWEITCNNRYQRRLHEVRHRNRVTAARRRDVDPPAIVPYSFTDNALFPYRQTYRLLRLHPKWIALHAADMREEAEANGPSMSSVNTMDAARPDGRDKENNRVRQIKALEEVRATCNLMAQFQRRTTIAVERATDLLQMETGHATEAFIEQYEFNSAVPLSTRHHYLGVSSAAGPGDLSADGSSSEPEDEDVRDEREDVSDEYQLVHDQDEDCSMNGSAYGQDELPLSNSSPNSRTTPPLRNRSS
jgi:hypothetical protein